MPKKKRQGHYCRICGDIKSNEKFSGKGHAAHICKSCASLPIERRNELQYLNRVAGMMFKPFLTKDERSLLKKYAKDDRYPELKEFAQSILDGRDNPPDVVDMEDDIFYDDDIDSLPFSE
ncbi:hypothetical protein [Macellibacteroides fermentans]|uniref:hypothetical protein n=1 Tax=Macellibacteroides fermentans TaxID=879969 RepID=UPI00406D45B5